MKFIVQTKLSRPKILAAFRGFLALVVWSVLFSTVSSARQPDFLLFLAEDVRADSFRFAGNTQANTPNLDRLMRHSATFDQAFTVIGDRKLSWETVLTSKLPQWDGTESKTVTVSALLRQNGYHVWSADWKIDQVEAVRQAFQQAWSEGGDRPRCFIIRFVAEQPEGSFDYAFLNESSGAWYDNSLTALEMESGDHHWPLPSHLKRSWNHRAWAFQQRQLQGVDPIQSYYRRLSSIDLMMGDFIHFIQENAGSSRIIVGFVTLQGVYLGERRMVGAWIPHEQVVRTLILWHDPVLSARHWGRRPQLVTLLDVAPTICELAGVAPASTFQGKSLLPLIQLEDVDWRDFVFGVQRVRPALIPPTEMVRTKRWKYIRYVETDPLAEELYDLRLDPLEKRNLIGRPGFDSIHKMMEARWREAVNRSSRVAAPVKEPPAAAIQSLDDSSDPGDLFQSLDTGGGKSGDPSQW